MFIEIADKFWFEKEIFKKIKSNEFFAFNTKLREMAMLASKDFTVAKTTLPPVGLGLMIIGSRA